MAAQADMAPLFAQPHQITTKIQNHHHSEPSEIELNGSLTTTELKKPHPFRLVDPPDCWRVGDTEQVGFTLTCGG